MTDVNIIRVDPEINIVNTHNKANYGGLTYLSKYLQSDEEDLATNDMVQDGSSTPKDFTTTVPTGFKYLLYRCFPRLEDGSTVFDSTKFGALTALGTGVQIIHKDGETETILETWKTNADIKDTMLDFDQGFKGNGSRIGRWSFHLDMGKAMVLEAGEKLMCRINDALAGIDIFTIKVKGRKLAI